MVMKIADLFNLVLLNAHIPNKHFGCQKLTHDEY